MPSSFLVVAVDVRDPLLRHDDEPYILVMPACLIQETLAGSGNVECKQFPENLLIRNVGRPSIRRENNFI